VEGYGFGKRRRGVEDDSYCRLVTPENAVVAKAVPMLLERGTRSLTVDIEGVRRRLIIDTGSNVSIMKPGVASSDIRATPLKPFGVTGETLDVRGRQSVTFKLGGRDFKHTFVVCQLPTDAAGLLGVDFLEKAGAIINFESSELLIPHRNRDPHKRDDATEERVALTVFTEGKEERIPQTPRQEARKRGEQTPTNPRSEAPTPQGRSWLVKANENVVLAPPCRQVVQGRLEMEGQQSPPPFSSCGTSPNSD
jgi:hypothetical protein